MSEQAAAEAVPEWDHADRMRKALRQADMGPGDMARYLGVGGNTVSTWLSGRINPSPQTLRLWSMRTGVPYSWLCHGTLESCQHRRKSVKPDCLTGMVA
jgi:transcriptional regulator with XRE-family HTH domain